MKRHLAFLAALSFAFSSAVQAELPRLGPEQVAGLLSLNQQLADIDQFVTTQFKKDAWDRIGEGLVRVLKAARTQEEFGVIVSRLKENRFRDCLQPEEYQKYLAERKRLRDEPSTLKAKPVEISEDLVEMLSVLDAAFLGLSIESDSWTFVKFPSTPAQGVDAVLNGLREYQTLHRRIAKLRVFVDLPAWVQDLLGEKERAELKATVAVLAEYDDRALISRVERRDDSLKEKDLKAELAKFRKLSSRVAEISTTLTGWFNSHLDQFKSLKQEWTDTLAKTVYDIPADAAKDGKPFFRAAVLPEGGGRFRARLYLCRRDPRINPDPVQGQTGLHEIDLGVTLLAVEVVGGTLKLALPGLGGDMKVDEKVLAIALQEFGWPQQLIASQIRVKSVERDLSGLTVEFATSVPGLASTTSVTFTVGPGKLAAETDLKTVLREKLTLARAELLKSLKGKSVSLPTAFGPLTVSDWSASDDWSLGAIRFDGEVTCGKYGTWRVPFEFQRDTRGWGLRISPTGVPGAILDKLLDEVRDQAFGGLNLSGLKADMKAKADKVQDVVGRLKRHLGVQSARFDRDSGQIVADVQWLDADLLGTASLPTVTIKLNVTTGKATFSADKLHESLKALLPELAKKLINRLTGNLTQKLVDALKGKKLGLFGAELEITEVGDFDESVGGVAVKAKVNVGEKTLKVRDLWLKTTMPGSEWKLEAVSADFSAVSTDPPLEEFVKSLVRTVIDLPDGVVQVSNIRPVQNGLRANVAVVIDALGGPLPLGELTISTGGLGVKPDLKPLLNQLGERVSQQFKDKITLPQLGPIRDLKPTVVTADLPTLRITLGGNLVLEGFDKISLPFENVQIFPSLDVSKVKIRIPDEVKTAVTKLLPLPEGSPVKINNLSVKDDKAPYGLTFDASFTILKTFTADLKRVALTQRGLDLPDRIGIQVPGFVPMGPLAFVNPGVGIYLKDPLGKIDILGDLTIASPGVEKVLAIKSSMTADLKSLKFRLTGSLILASFIPVFGVNGEVDLNSGVFDLDARTLPPIDKILNVQGKIHVDGPAMRVTSMAHLQVLGIDLVSVDMVVDLREKVLKFAGRVNFLLGEASIKVSLSPDLSRMSASASLSFKLAGFEIGGASIEITPARTQLQFRILGFKVTVIVATVSCLTPKIVLDVILSLFDFDIAGFFNAVVNRDVVVNLIPSKGKKEGSVGEGTPLPPGEREGKAADQAKQPYDQQPPSAQSASRPESDNREGAPPKSTTPGQPPPGGWPRTPDAAKENRPIEVVAYKPAPAKDGGSIRYVEDGTSKKFVEVSVSEDGKSTWESHFLIEAEVVDHLRNTKQPAMILSSAYLSLPPGSLVRCRNNYEHDWVPVYIMLQADGYYVAGRYPGGKYQKLPLDTLAVGDAPNPQKAWELITKEGMRPFSVGDLGLLADFAAVGVDPSVKLATPRRLAGKKPEEDGYVYVRNREPDKRRVFRATTEAVFRSRKGMTFTVPDTSDLYAPLTDDKSQLSVHLGNYLVRTSADQEPIGLIAIDSQNKRAAFARSNAQGKHFVDGLDAKQGWKTALLESELGRPFGLDRPLWPSGEFTKLFTEQLVNGKWNEVRVRSTTSTAKRALFSNNLAENDWQIGLVSEIPAKGGETSPTAKAGTAVKGEAIAKKYQEWRGTTVRGVTPKGVEVFGDLSKLAQRQSLLKLLVGREEDFSLYFEGNPYDLLLPSK